MSHGFGLASAQPSMCLWDCAHYLELSKDLKPGAFFPLFALLGKWLSMATPLSEVNSLLVLSNLFNVISGVLCLYFGQKFWFESSSKSYFGFKLESWILLSSMSFFPQHLFSVVGYTESLFMMLLLAGWLSLWSNALTFSAIFFALTAVTRPQGLWVVGLMGGFAIVQMLKQKQDTMKWIKFGLILIIPFSIFLYWNEAIQGDVFFFLKEQRKWGRAFDFISGLKNHLPRYDDSHVYLYLTLFAAYRWLKSGRDLRVVFLAVMMLAFAEIPLFYGGYYSYVRFVAVNLGLFCFYSEYLAKRPILLLFWLVWSLSRLAISSFNYTQGLWSG